jgi:hypothetical protein
MAMCPFEKSHAVALVKGHGGLFSKAAVDDALWNFNEALDFTIGQPLKGLFLVALVFNILSRPVVCGNGGVRLFR